MSFVYMRNPSIEVMVNAALAALETDTTMGTIADEFDVSLAQVEE